MSEPPSSPSPSPSPSPASAPSRAARSPVVVLVGLQLLFAMAVMAAVWGSSQHLRRLALEHLLDHAQVQTHNLEDRLSQSFHLLHMHLRTLMVEHPEPADAPAQFTTALQALQHKLPYLRSLSAMDAQGRIVVSTHAANVGQQLALGRLLPQVAPQTPGLLRFGPPWQGRDFADGAPWPQQRLAQSVADAGFFPVTLVLPEAPQWTLVAAINSDYFINLALNHRVSSELRYRVYADDGTLLFSSAEDDQPGMPLAQHARLQEVLARQVGTAQWPQEGLDDTWLVAFRVSRSYPWFVQSQASRHEVLADWRSETRTLAWMAGVTLLALLLVTGTLTYWVQRSWVQEQRHLEESRLAASVMEHTHDGVMVCDAQQCIIDVNPAFTRISGYTREQALGQRPGMLSSGRRNTEQSRLMWLALLQVGHWQGEFWNRRSDGSLYAAASTINAVSDESGQVTHYINVFSDITERKHHQEHLERQAHFDPLTRLPNRALLADRLSQAMARACSEQHGLAVCFLDLDGFKAVNDTHGHEAGDELLVIVAQRLQAHIRTGDTAARLGGDEFVVLLCDLRDLHECEQMAQRLLRAICEPMVVEGHTVQVGASMGIALYPQHGSQAEQLLRLADQAMYQAKQSGRNRCIFHAIEGESAQRVVLR